MERRGGAWRARVSDGEATARASSVGAAYLVLEGGEEEEPAGESSVGRGREGKRGASHFHDLDGDPRLSAADLAGLRLPRSQA